VCVCVCVCVCVVRRNAAFLLDTNAASHGAGAAWDRAAPARPLGMRIRTRALASEPDDAVAERTARRGLAESLDGGHVEVMQDLQQPQPASSVY